MNKRILAILLSALVVANISSCNYVSENKTDNTFKNTDTIESTNEITNDIEVPETCNIESEYDPTTNMRYTLIDGGKAYSVCPEGLPEVIKELVIPGEYKVLPITEIKGSFSNTVLKH